MREEWRVIASHPKYEVSSFGRIRRGQRVMRQQTERNGYVRVMLDDRRRHLVHRLVAAAFCDQREYCDQVNHKNGVKSDNGSSNLEWVTSSENHRHSFASLGRKHWATGITGARNPLSMPVKALDLDGSVRTFENAAHAVKCGHATNKFHINSCCNGRRTSHAGKAWSYA